IAKSRHLRTRMINGKVNFLTPTPQSLISLHEIVKSPIIPLVSIPEGRLTRSRLTFLDAPIIDETSRKFMKAGRKAFHGEMSTAINQVLFPYCLSYIHCWEEIMTFATRVMNMKVQFPKGTSIVQFIEKIHDFEKNQLILNTHEPGREDSRILEWIDDTWHHVKSMIKVSGIDDKKPFLDRKSYIKLGGLETRGMFQKVIGVAMKLFKDKGLLEISRYLEIRSREIPAMFSNDS
ncbi:MAG: hypothetical protein ACTSXU_16875, partial [Promethearchaeota archaeon]